MQSFIIKGKLDGLNKVINVNRSNLHAGNNLKKKNEGIVIYYARLCGLKPIEKYHLTPFVIDKKMEHFIKKGKIRTFNE